MSDYSCPVDSCEYEGKQTALMNHLRLKQDSDHTDMYQRFKGGSSDSNDDNDSNDVDQEDPKLEESFNEAMNEEDENESSESEVTKLGSMTEEEDESESSEMVSIGEVEIEDVVAQGHAKNKKQAIKHLKKAKNDGYSKIDMETGEVA